MISLVQTTQNKSIDTVRNMAKNERTATPTYTLVLRVASELKQ